MMPGPAYTESRLRAKYHVQVEIERRDIDQTPACVPVSCRVHRIFRGDALLTVGDTVRFSVAVFREYDDIPAGGDRWMHYDVFEQATYLEVFLDGTPPDCKVARSQRYPITRLSDTPQIAVPTEEELAAEWEEFHSAHL